MDTSVSPLRFPRFPGRTRSRRIAAFLTAAYLLLFLADGLCSVANDFLVFPPPFHRVPPRPGARRQPRPLVRPPDVPADGAHPPPCRSGSSCPPILFDTFLSTALPDRSPRPHPGPFRMPGRTRPGDARLGAGGDGASGKTSSIPRSSGRRRSAGGTSWVSGRWRSSSSCPPSSSTSSSAGRSRWRRPPSTSSSSTGPGSSWTPRSSSATTARPVELIPMVHIGDAAFYDRVKAFVPDDSVVLLEGVSDRDGLLRRRLDYAPVASGLGLSSQADGLPPPGEEGQGEIRRADVDVSDFSPDTRAFIEHVGQLAAHLSWPAYLQFQRPDAGRPPAEPARLRKHVPGDPRRPEPARPGGNQGPPSRGGADTVVLPWGAMHMPGLAEGVRGAGVHLAETHPFSAIRFGAILGRLFHRPSPPAEAPLPASVTGVRGGSPYKPLPFPLISDLPPEVLPLSEGKRGRQRRPPVENGKDETENGESQEGEEEADLNPLHGSTLSPDGAGNKPAPYCGISFRKSTIDSLFAPTRSRTSAVNFPTAVVEIRSAASRRIGAGVLAGEEMAEVHEGPVPDGGGGRREARCGSCRPGPGSRPPPWRWENRGSSRSTPACRGRRGTASRASGTPAANGCPPSATALLNG